MTLTLTLTLPAILTVALAVTLTLTSAVAACPPRKPGGTGKTGVFLYLTACVEPSAQKAYSLGTLNYLSRRNKELNAVTVRGSHECTRGARMHALRRRGRRPEAREAVRRRWSRTSDVQGYHMLPVSDTEDTA